MKNISKGPKIVKKMSPPPRVPPENKIITGRTEKTIPTNTPNIPNQFSSNKITNTRKPKASPDSSLNHLKENHSPNMPNGDNTDTIIKIDEHNLQYIGGIENGRFEGMGTLYNIQEGKNKYVYKGEWKNGARSGQGHYIYPDYSQYNGEWLDNLKHGQGTLQSDQGEYKGNWSYGKRHGSGTMILKNGVVLSGQWQQDNFVGGQVTYEDGTTYEGGVRNFERDGKGNYIYSQKCRYSGLWSGNQKTGSGRYEFDNGDMYEGEFRRSKREGVGKYSWKNYPYEIVDALYANDQLEGGKVYDRQQQKIIKNL